MVETICTECQTQNPAGSPFCTACGHKLEAPEVLVRDVGESLQQGYKLVADRRFDQAMLIANSVLGKAPNESGAYALMAMVHEETGDIAEAIRCYEEVVRIRPESKIDAIKLAQLKLQTNPSEAVSIRKPPVFAIAVASTLLVLAVGLAFAYPRDEAPPAEGGLVADATAQGFSVPESQPAVQPTQPPATTPETQPAQQPATPATTTPRSNRPALPPAGRSGTLPPLVVDVTPSELANMTKKPPASNDTPPPPRAEDSNVIERGPGQINITESRRGSSADPGVSGNTYRVAQDKMKAGDYQGAIRDFEAALPGSDKKALIHQMIGRCHTRLGDKAAARRHFETALSMYEAAGAKASADAVRREIELLG